MWIDDLKRAGHRHLGGGGNGGCLPNGYLLGSWGRKTGVKYAIVRIAKTAQRRTAGDPAGSNQDVQTRTYLIGVNVRAGISKRNLPLNRPDRPD